MWPLCKGTKTLFVPVIRNIFPPVSNNCGHLILETIIMLHLCTQNFNAFAMDVRGGLVELFLELLLPFSLTTEEVFAIIKLAHSQSELCSTFCIPISFIFVCFAQEMKKAIRIISTFFQYVQNN